MAREGNSARVLNDLVDEDGGVSPCGDANPILSINETSEASWTLSVDRKGWRNYSSVMSHPPDSLGKETVSPEVSLGEVHRSSSMFGVSGFVDLYSERHSSVSTVEAP